LIQKVEKEIKLVRSRRPFCHIVGFCNPIRSGNMAPNIKIINFAFLQICKKKENLAFLRENSIAYVEKEENPPSAPQIRPIENYWGILKMKVYEGNWSAKDREALIRRIRAQYI